MPSDLRASSPLRRLAVAFLARLGLRRPRPREFAADDFDWRTYHAVYQGELEAIARQHTLQLRPGDYARDDGALRRAAAALPLHPNHRLLYETVLLLRPESVVEVGCGGGDHLHNLALLEPRLRLCGLDRSEAQLAFLRRRSPDLRAAVRALDVTRALPPDAPQADVAYTQAVIMHIQTGEAHRAALAALFRMASRQVVLMENWRKHAFLSEVRRLHAAKAVPWRELHAYFRRAPERGGRPHLMVLSAVPLRDAAAFEPLDDDATLREAMD